MKSFICYYLTQQRKPVGGSRQTVTATSPETSAQIYAQQYPGDYPKICVERDLRRFEFKNPKRQELEQQERAEEAQKEDEAKELKRLEFLQELFSSVERADGNLAELSYSELNSLIENLEDYPNLRDKMSSLECAVREKLYKVALFDRNLQAALLTRQALLQTKQAALQVQLLSQIASGQPAAGAAGPGESNLAKGTAMMGVAALQKLNQIEENTEEVSEGFGFD